VVGKTLGHYEILEALGKGGMGEVYRAHDPELGRDVAIKVLPEHLADDPERLARLRREARALASVNHPGIATIHAFEEDGGTRFIVMEVLEGATLKEKLGAGAMGVEEALEVAIQIARALEAAHAQGIVHRDLKPDNVMIGATGQVKVLDFGLAKTLRPKGECTESELLTVTVEATRTGAMMGTPPYMSPEQIRGGKVGEQTDVWAFGCVLYEMLTGKRAFAAETPSDTLADILTREPAWDALPKAAPARVGELLERILRKDTDRRLQHIGDARIELEEAREALSAPVLAAVHPAAGEPGAGAPRSAGPAPGSAAGSHRGVGLKMAVAALSLATVALAAGWYFLGGSGDRGTTDRSIAVLPFETLGRKEATVFTQGIHGDVLARLSGIADLEVTSRHSVMRFQDSDMSLPEIARELGVMWIVAGEVQEVGDQVQVNARLIDALQDRQVWAESYRRQLTAENLFRIQGELTARIAEQLQAQLTPEELRAVERVPTENLEAYRLYAQGRGLLDRRTPEEMQRAVGYFQRAIEQDADFSLAWVGLADALLLLEDYRHVEPGSLLPRAREAARRALELAPDQAEPHASYGLLHIVERDGPAAIEELQRAVELRPSYADAHNWLAWLHLLLGQRQEALESAQRAVELDPLSPEPLSNLSWSLLANGDAANALRTAQLTRELQPDFTTGHFNEAVALYQLGRFAEAGSVLRELSVPWTGSGPLATLAMVRAAMGEEARARELLELLEQADEPALIGSVLAALHEEDRAFTVLDSVERWDAWPTLSTRYFFPDVLGALREDPRYQRILGRMNSSWGLQQSNGSYVVEMSAVETSPDNFAFLAPPEIPSGWITFRMKNEGEQPHFLLLRRLPDGITFGDYTAEVSRPFEALYARYQAGEMEGTEMLEDLGGALPAWFASSPAMGGVGLTAPGRTAQATVLLQPGDYVMECYVVSPEGKFHSSLGMLRPLTVTSDSSGTSPPEADVEITLSNYELVVEGELTRGEQIVRVYVRDRAEGLVGHNVHLARLDEGTRIEDVVKWMDWVDALRPPAPVEFLGGTEEVPPGYATFLTVNLEPGRYAWISEGYGDRGMVKEFTIR